MSMSMNRERTASESSDSSIPSTSSTTSSAQSHPSELPHSPEEEEPPALNFQQVKYKDGGAHWYRASAVLLAYHK